MVVSEERRERNPNLEKYKCENCGKGFWRSVKRKSTNLKAGGIRGVGYTTCSPTCAREYQRKLTLGSSKKDLNRKKN